MYVVRTSKSPSNLLGLAGGIYPFILHFPFGQNYKKPQWSFVHLTFVEMKRALNRANHWWNQGMKKFLQWAEKRLGRVSKEPRIIKGNACQRLAFVAKWAFLSQQALILKSHPRLFRYLRYEQLAVYFHQISTALYLCLFPSSSYRRGPFKAWGKSPYESVDSCQRANTETTQVPQTYKAPCARLRLREISSKCHFPRLIALCLGCSILSWHNANNAFCNEERTGGSDSFWKE